TSRWLSPHFSQSNHMATLRASPLKDSPSPFPAFHPVVARRRRQDLCRSRSLPSLAQRRPLSAPSAYLRNPILHLPHKALAAQNQLPLHRGPRLFHRPHQTLLDKAPIAHRPLPASSAHFSEH